MSIANLVSGAGGAVGMALGGPVGAMLGQAVGDAVGKVAQNELNRGSGANASGAGAGAGGDVLNSAAQMLGGGIKL